MLQKVAKLCKTNTKRCQTYAKRRIFYTKCCKILQNFARSGLLAGGGIEVNTPPETA